MRTSTIPLRLALPAFAAATLLLAGCSSDDEGGDSGGGTTGGSGEQQEQQEQEQGAEQGGGGGGEGLEGNWATGLGESDSTLSIMGANASFTESLAGGMDSAFCIGQVSDTSMTLDCDNGETEWNQADLALDGDTLTVTWGSGTTQTYERLDADLPEMPMPEMPDMEMPEAP